MMANATDDAQPEQEISLSPLSNSTKDISATAGGGQAETVAKHYNDLKEVGLEGRKESRIFYMRNFNNWVKSVQINEILSRIRRRDTGVRLSVLDLACGKGGDQRKWRIARVARVVFADIAETSIEQCKNRFQELCQKDRRTPFEADFIAADCSTELLSERYSDPDVQFHMTSCQFAVHYTFESKQQAITMIRNACDTLKPGGYFFGTTVNSCEVVHRLLLSDNLSFGNEVYSVTFDSKDSFSTFGCKYNFHLEGVVDCPEFLVHFETFIKIAASFGMKLVYRKTFGEMFQENHKEREANRLLNAMFALEPYPPTGGKQLVSDDDEEYRHAADFIKQQHLSPHRNQIGTMTVSEWEAINMYMAFAFVKDDKEPPSPEEREKVLDSIPEDGAIRLRDLISGRKPPKDPPTVELSAVTQHRHRKRPHHRDGSYNRDDGWKRQRNH